MVNPDDVARLAEESANSAEEEVTRLAAVEEAKWATREANLIAPFEKQMSIRVATEVERRLALQENPSITSTSGVGISKGVDLGTNKDGPSYNQIGMEYTPPPIQIP